MGKLLRIIDDHFNKIVPFTLDPPGLAGGDVKLIIGPMTLPPHIPGSANLDGKVNIVDGASKPVACMNLNMRVPALAEEDASLNFPAVTGGHSCGKPSDHLKNLKTTSSGGVTKLTGTLD